MVVYLLSIIDVLFNYVQALEQAVLMTRMCEQYGHAAFWAFVVLDSSLIVAFNFHFHIAVRAQANFIHSASLKLVKRDDITLT
jgi:hypothetical protein